MAVNASNLILGPGTLYVAPYGTTEPPDSSMTPNGLAFVPPAPWTDVGGTDGGVTFEADDTYTDLEVDQVIMPVGSRRTATKMSIMAKLSEMTLANFNTAINQLAILAAGTGYQTLDIPVTAAYAQPTYAALMIIGPGGTLASGQPAGRMVIVRKTLSQVKASFTWDKKTQQSLDCTFAAYYVSGSINPVHMVTEEE